MKALFVNMNASFSDKFSKKSVFFLNLRVFPIQKGGFTGAVA